MNSDAKSEKTGIEAGLKNLHIERYSIKPSMDWMPNDYADLVDESILNINFEPDIFQKQAFYLLSQKKSVFVSAHTSSGKTLVAEYAIGLSLKNSSRAIYTSPIKALSNQKFFDFKQKFPDVGLITGDIQMNTDAQCLIMTTEILRNLVYKNSEILRNTEYLIFDEVHYINNAERGVVWEECIIMLPKHITLVMLSATIPNSLEFAEWVGRTRAICIYVISTSKRAVPLEFTVYCDSSAFLIEDTKKGPKSTNFPTELPVFNKNIKPTSRFRINDLGNFINNKRLTPAIFFTFSRRACEEYGKSLQLLDLTTLEEKTSITKFLENAMQNLREEDTYLPQIKNMRDQVYRGVAIHHGALLPFVKECVELLFSENLIKILVATETFAMGINMPAKCCVFLSLTKIDDGAFRYLHTSEFIQMSGRAGRRGMDKVGTVLIADQRMPNLAAIKKIIDGPPVNLNSKFKLSFSLILTAIITNIDVIDLMKSSFKEHGSQKTLKADMEKVTLLKSAPRIKCEKCSGYSEFFSKLSELVQGIPAVFKRGIKVGDTVILKNNSIVKVDNVFKDGIIFSNSPEMLKTSLLFSLPVTSEVIKLTEAEKTECCFKYPIIYRNVVDRGTASFDEIAFYVKNSTISFEFNETDVRHLPKITELKLRFTDFLKNRLFECPLLEKHYIDALHSKSIDEDISFITSKYSEENLALMGEYTARMAFLKQHLFISDTITLKGRVAAEIETANNVLVAEFIFNNELENFTPSEAVAVFSTMIAEDKIEEYQISPELEAKVEILQKHYDNLSETLDNMSIPRFESLNLSLVQPVHEWCSGASLGKIVELYRIQEGTFVRLLLRLDECCREMINVGDLIGDDKISKKFAQASESMKRDIVFQPSLYV